MSELYSVEVERVADATVTLRVTTVHPDAGPPPEAPTFPLNLLVDLWSLFEQGYAGLVEGAPPGDEAKALARTAPWGPPLAQLCELSHGKKQLVDEAEYKRLQSAMMNGETLTFDGKQVAGLSMSNGACHVMLQGDEAAFARAAAELTSSYVVDERENQAMYDDWTDDGEVPRARLTVTLTSPKLLGFVRPGLRYDTAAYY